MLTEAMKTRKSVRTFDGRPLSPQDREKLERFLSQTENPFSIPVRFVFLDKTENGLSSPVLSGEPLYLAAKVNRVPHGEEALGYSLEMLVLYAWSLGIGTTWIGGTMDRAKFERAAKVGSDERMPIVTPLGYPAKKRSVKEILMRKGVRADDRKAFGELFFDGKPGVPMAIDPSDPAAQALGNVRWAPSAVNKQPWRVIRQGSDFHFYLQHDRGYISDAVGDMQKIDMGIALCHFCQTLTEGKTPYSFLTDDPGLSSSDDLEYIITVRI